MGFPPDFPFKWFALCWIREMVHHSRRTTHDLHCTPWAKPCSYRGWSVHFLPTAWLAAAKILLNHDQIDRLHSLVLFSVFTESFVFYVWFSEVMASSSWVSFLILLFSICNSLGNPGEGTQSFFLITIFWHRYLILALTLGCRLQAHRLCLFYQHCLFKQRFRVCFAASKPSI